MSKYVYVLVGTHRYDNYSTVFCVCDTKEQAEYRKEIEYKNYAGENDEYTCDFDFNIDNVMYIQIPVDEYAEFLKLKEKFEPNLDGQ